MINVLLTLKTNNLELYSLISNTEILPRVGDFVDVFVEEMGHYPQVEYVLVYPKLSTQKKIKMEKYIDAIVYLKK